VCGGLLLQLKNVDLTEVLLHLCESGRDRGAVEHVDSESCVVDVVFGELRDDPLLLGWTAR
jgi:hypothetical protein